MWQECGKSKMRKRETFENTIFEIYLTPPSHGGNPGSIPGGVTKSFIKGIRILVIPFLQYMNACSLNCRQKLCAIGGIGRRTRLRI